MGSGGRPGRGGDEVVPLIVTCLGENLISQELGRGYFAGFKFSIWSTKFITNRNQISRKLSKYESTSDYHNFLAQPTPNKPLLKHLPRRLADSVVCHFTREISNDNNNNNKNTFVIRIFRKNVQMHLHAFSLY